MGKKKREIEAEIEERTRKLEAEDTAAVTENEQKDCPVIDCPFPAEYPHEHANEEEMAHNITGAQFRPLEFFVEPDSIEAEEWAAQICASLNLTADGVNQEILTAIVERLTLRTEQIFRERAAFVIESTGMNYTPEFGPMFGEFISLRAYFAHQLRATRVL